RRRATVTGPLGEPVEAEFGVLPDGTAVVESARASGLALLDGPNDPLHATSRGTGELIRAAVRGGARRVVVAVGGSAMTDGGLGGWRRGAPGSNPASTSSPGPPGSMRRSTASTSS